MPMITSFTARAASRNSEGIVDGDLLLDHRRRKQRQREHNGGAQAAFDGVK